MLSIKHFIKKYFWKLVFYHKIFGTTSKENKLFIEKLGLSSTSVKKLNIFTKDDEDGILLEILHKTGTLNKKFVDIGSNDCINSNCANLAFHHGFSGAFIDGNKEVLERGEYIYRQHFKHKKQHFIFKQAIVTPQNINEIVNDFHLPIDVDLLCIDLDGNDYFIWENLTAILPRVVVTEVQVEKFETEFVPDYAHEFEPYESGLPKGASPLSMIKLGRQKGYTLVAANKGGYNLFFVRNDALGNLKELTLEKMIKNLPSSSSPGIIQHVPA